MPSNAQETSRAGRGPAELLAGTDGRAVRFRADSARQRLQPVLDKWTRGLEDGAVRLVKHNVARTVYRCQTAAGVVFFKHFHSPSLFHRLQRRLGPSDALCEMRFSEYPSAPTPGMPGSSPRRTCPRSGRACWPWPSLSGECTRPG